MLMEESSPVRFETRVPWVSVLALDVNVKNIGQTGKPMNQEDEWRNRSRCRELQSSDICRQVGNFTAVSRYRLHRCGKPAVVRAGKPT